jgi:hypothetical protein
LIIENLTEENFLLQSAKHYKNKQCQNTEEFLSDLKHIKYIKKLLTRYNKKNLLDEKLILNHIIILNNVFGPIFLSRLIFLKFYTQLFYLKPFLLYLNLLPDVVNGVNGLDYNTVAIEMDWNIIEKLREINNNAYKN